MDNVSDHEAKERDVPMYKTDISTAKWIIYDIFGNIGWIAYYIVLGKCFVEEPDFMEYRGLTAAIITAVIPALFMLVGIVELINERIHKLDYVLSKIRVYRGFGALTAGGITGAVISFIGIVYAVMAGVEADITYLYILLSGSVLCAIFAGLCFKGYRKID